MARSLRSEQAVVWKPARNASDPPSTSLASPFLIVKHDHDEIGVRQHGGSLVVNGLRRRPPDRGGIVTSRTHKEARRCSVTMAPPARRTARVHRPSAFSPSLAN